jgi:hypothetical protein
LRALAYRDFRLLFGSMIVSQTGNWMQMVANSWLLLQLTNSPFLLGLQGLFTSVPFIFSSIYGGALADRADRRRLLQITQSLQILSSVVQGLLVWLGVIQVWQIYLFGALNWSIGGVDQAGRQAILPTLVPRSHLSSAIALNSSVRRGAGIIGPALGGLAVANLGLAGAYWLNAATFLPLIFSLAAMNISNSHLQAPRRSFAAAVADGVRYAQRQRLIFGLLGIEACTGIFASAQPIMAVFARDVFHVGAEGLGVLLSMLGIGSLIGTGVLVLAGSALVRGRFIVLTTLAAAAALLAFAVSRVYAVALAMLLLAGAFDMMAGALRNSAVQLSVDDTYRGRIMSLLGICSRGVSPLGGLQAGGLASLFGAPLAIVAGCLVTLGWTTATTLRVPEILAFDERELEAARTEPAALASA